MNLKKLILTSVALGMGIATLVLNIMETLDSKNGITLLSIGLICLAVSELEKTGK